MTFRDWLKKEFDIAKYNTDGQPEPFVYRMVDGAGVILGTIMYTSDYLARKLGL